MAFLDNTGLSRFWQHVVALADGLTPKTRKINGKALTNDITITAADLGLEQAMRFLGTSGIAISDGDTDANITIGGSAVVAQTGDVVLYGGKEFIFSTNGWEELGNEGSHALKSITITAGNGLTGGGDLSANRTINVGQGSGILVEADKVSHADTSSVANVTEANRTYVKSLTFDGFGHVTAVSTGTETVVDTDTGATSITTTGSGNAVTTASYDEATRKITLTKGASYVPTSRTVNGKALSSNITLSAGDVSAYTKAEVDTALDAKVDKVSGKGLSTNDYTTTEKEKLAGIAAGATANTGTITEVQANGTSIATSGVADIPAASTSKYGVTKLSSSTNSTSAVLAATPKAVKSAYDLAAAAMPKSGGTFTGTVTLAADPASNLEPATKQYVDNHVPDITVDSTLSSTSTNPIQNKAINTALAGKENTISLTASRALVSNSSGKVAVSAVTSTELGYLDGVTSAIQTQLNGKLGTSEQAASANKVYSTASTSKAYVLGTTSTGSSDKSTVYNASVYTSGSVLYGAAWNDYAEYRETLESIQPGRVVCENGDDTLSLATERLQPGAEIVSDTFGFAIGETEKSKTPIAVSGRVLAYTYEDRNSFKAGDPVCAGPQGTVSKMTREEVREYPDRIIGTVSAIPNYKTWGADNIEVNERIWIKIK